ncbi:hypothetical protein [Xanthomonas citri]|uniref:hypothetical protein n=1 Tax=Xanthomonas citri TaxID=346 RepID=UPI000C17CD29|nr:hypothetical protein [Xanthomonas citri]ATS54075.1 hypothetical protein XcfCFBP6994P_01900 [Xanthomonas citri pv. phaseoli var. fuscans]SOO32787.1 conserved hypothetical protein [Xanthomonas citri pv. fuscans]
MRERPILFNGAMVRAILSGAKSQTRRAVKPQPAPGQGMVNAAYCGDRHLWLRDGSCDKTDPAKEWRCPFGQPGDRLWVRETWAQHADHPAMRRAVYRADSGSEHDAERWRPNIHMPRWACRLVMEITDVRVERLQAISEADAQREGAGDNVDYTRNRTYRDDFRDIWTSTGGDWDANPWVWVIGFKVVDQQAKQEVQL